MVANTIPLYMKSEVIAQYVQYMGENGFPNDIWVEDPSGHVCKLDLLALTRTIAGAFDREETNPGGYKDWIPAKWTVLPTERRDADGRQYRTIEVDWVKICK